MNVVRKTIDTDIVLNRVINTNKNVIKYLPCLIGITGNVNHIIQQVTVNRELTKLYIRTTLNKHVENIAFNKKALSLPYFLSSLKVEDYMVYVFTLPEEVKDTFRLFLDSKYSSIPQNHKDIIYKMSGFINVAIQYFSIDGSEIKEKEYKAEQKKCIDLIQEYHSKGLTWSGMMPYKIYNYNHFTLALKNDAESRKIVAESLDISADELGDDIYTYADESNYETQLTNN